MAQLRDVAAQYDIVMQEHTPGDCFKELIRKLSRSGPVVILVDEYDKPILDNITNPDLPQIMRILKGFYSTIKDCNAQERFVFITGVSKFSHVSIFSDLNNLKDLSMNRDYAAMLGFTQAELETHFGELLVQYAAEKELSVPELTAKIREWYNGYRFHPKAETVYNPVSAGSFFEHGEFLNYWIKTGVSGFLMELAQQQEYNFAQLPTSPVRDTTLSVSTIDKLKISALMFQTGYLTISSSEEINGERAYYLDFPNREVRQSFVEGILESYAAANDENLFALSKQLVAAMNSGDTDRMYTVLRVFFAGVPYNITQKKEHVFQSIFYSIFSLLGFRILAEDYTNLGRADVTLETAKYIYIFEFKLNNNRRALKQILEKQYYEKYLLRGKELILIGANFSSKTGQLINWKAKKLSD